MFKRLFSGKKKNNSKDGNGSTTSTSNGLHGQTGHSSVKTPLETLAGGSSGSGSYGQREACMHHTGSKTDNQCPYAPKAASSSVSKDKGAETVTWRPVTTPPPTTSSSTKKRKKKKKRARVKGRKPIFPVDHIHDLLLHSSRYKHGELPDPVIPVFMGAVEEYVAAELLECAGNLAKTRGSDEISEHDIIATIFSDDELLHVLQDCLHY